MMRAQFFTAVCVAHISTVTSGTSMGSMSVPRLSDPAPFPSPYITTAVFESLNEIASPIATANVPPTESA